MSIDSYFVWRNSLVLFLILLFCIGFPINSIHAKEKQKFKQVRVLLEKDFNIVWLFKQYIRKDVKLKKSMPMVQKTFKANPQIQNWRRIKKGSTIILYLNSDLLKVRKKKKKRQVSKKNKKNKKNSFKLSAQGGQVEISDQDSNTLNMNFARFGLQYNQQSNGKYSYHAGFSIIAYFNITYSLTPQAEEQSDPLPAFNLAVSRSFDSPFRLKLAYSTLPYFVLNSNQESEFSFLIDNIHRVNLSPSYMFGQNYVLFSSHGLIAGAGQGVENSLGITRMFSKDSAIPISLTLLGYMSVLKVEDREETSKAFLLSLGLSI